MKSNSQQQVATQPKRKANSQDIDVSDKKLKAFADYYDDSSDEESVESAVATYDINKSWQQFKTESSIVKENRTKSCEQNKKTSLNNDLLLSFVAHSAGIKLLYSHQVNEKYYALKKNLLSSKSENGLNQLERIIKNALITTIKIAEIVMQNAFKIAKQTQPNINVIESNLNEFIKRCHKNIDTVIAMQLNEFINCLKNPKLISSKFIQKIIYMFLNKEEVRNRETSSCLMRDSIKEDLFNLMKKRIQEFSMHSKLGNFNNCEGKTVALNAIQTYQGDFTNLIKNIEIVIAQSKAQGNIEKIIFKKITEDDHKIKLVRAYIENLMTLYLHKQKSLSSLELEQLKKYVNFDVNTSKHEFVNLLIEILPYQLMSMINSFHRPTLNKCHVFYSDDAYSFYAQKRLNNRSQKRQILNLNYSLFTNDISLRIWNMKNGQSHEEVIELQEISAASLSRKDSVIGIGTYEKMYEAIVQLKEYFISKNQIVDDQKIAIWMRTILTGRELEFNFTHDSMKIDEMVISQKLCAMTYLLFGCEPTRNPAMIIVNQMLLDLIIETNYSFEEALTSTYQSKPITNDLKLMPMAPEGAVTIARALESDYRQYMPIPYVYPGIQLHEQRENKFNKFDLIKLEAAIIRSWIGLKKVSYNSKNVDDLTKNILQLIENQFDIWFSKQPHQATRMMACRHEKLPQRRP